MYYTKVHWTSIINIPEGSSANRPFGNCPHGKHAGRTEVSQISLTVYAALGKRINAMSYPSLTTVKELNFSCTMTSEDWI